MRRWVFLIALLLLPGSARAVVTDYWVTQSGAGAANGTNVGNAAPWTNLALSATCSTSSGPVGPGTTVHLNGTFTVSTGSTGVVLMNCSGSAGNPIWYKFEPGSVCQSVRFAWSVGGPTGGCLQVPTGGLSYIKFGGATACGAAQPGSLAPGANNCDGTIENTGYGTAFACSGCGPSTQSGLLMLGTCNNCEVAGIAFLNAYVRAPNWALTSGTCSGSGTISCSFSCAATCTVGTGIIVAVSGNALVASSSALYTVTGNSGGNSVQFSGTSGLAAGTASGGTMADETLGNGLNEVNDIVMNGTETGTSIHDNYFSNVGWALLGFGPNTLFYNNYFVNYDHGIASGPSDAVSGTGGDKIYGNYFSSMKNWDDGTFTNSDHHDPIHNQVDTTNNPQRFFNGMLIYKNRFEADGLPNALMFLRASSKGEVVFENVLACATPIVFAEPAMINFGDSSNWAGPSFTQNFAAYNNTWYNCAAYTNGEAIQTPASASSGTIENNYINGQKITVVVTPGTVTTSDYNVYGMTAFDSGNTIGVWPFGWTSHNTGCLLSSVLGGATTICDTDRGLAQNNPGGNYTYGQTNSGQDTHSQMASIATANLDSNAKPQAGSPLIGAGVNLTSLCGTLPQLCTDIMGNPRPATGPWDVGAYQTSAAVILPPLNMSLAAH